MFFAFLMLPLENLKLHSCPAFAFPIIPLLAIPALDNERQKLLAFIHSDSYSPIRILCTGNAKINMAVFVHITGVRVYWHGMGHGASRPWWVLGEVSHGFWHPCPMPSSHRPPPALHFYCGPLSPSQLFPSFHPLLYPCGNKTLKSALRTTHIELTFSLV